MSFERTLTTSEAAEYIGVSPQTLTTWRSTKKVQIPYLKIGTRLVRYRREDLDAYLAKREVNPAG